MLIVKSQNELIFTIIFKEILQKISNISLSYQNVTKKQCFDLYQEKKFFEKPQMEVKLTSPTFLGLTSTANINLPTFN